MGVAQADHVYPGRDEEHDGMTLAAFVDLINDELARRRADAELARRHAVAEPGDAGASCSGPKLEERTTSGSSARNYDHGTTLECVPDDGVPVSRESHAMGYEVSEAPSEVEESSATRKMSAASGSGPFGARAHSHKLTVEEVIAVRLYTGPAYVPINGWLREVAELPKEPKHSSSRWGAWTPERALMDAQSARREAALDKSSSWGATVGLLVGALGKIASHNTRAESECTLYRGLEGLLPGEFWLPDQLGVVCATDSAFMSTSLEQATAIHYMTRPERGRARGKGLLWEIRAGAEDANGHHCGANVSLLSQFGAEKEVLFPPLTMLRVMARNEAIDVPRRLEAARSDVLTRALCRARLLSQIPGANAEINRQRALWRAAVGGMLCAKTIVERTIRNHEVLEETATTSSNAEHPYVRVVVQPRFTVGEVDAESSYRQSRELAALELEVDALATSQEESMGARRSSTSTGRSSALSSRDCDARCSSSTSSGRDTSRSFTAALFNRGSVAKIPDAFSVIQRASLAAPGSGLALGGHRLSLGESQH